MSTRDNTTLLYARLATYNQWTTQGRKVLKIWLAVHCIIATVLLVGCAIAVVALSRNDPRNPLVFFERHSTAHLTKRGNDNTTIIIINNITPTPGIDADYCIDDSSKTTHDRRHQIGVFLLALFLGTFGVARCYAGFCCCGIFQFLTLGGLEIWTLIDWILVASDGWTHDGDGFCFIPW